MTFEEWKSLDGDKVPSTSGFSDKLFEYIKPSGKVLDLGCGYGRISELLKNQGYEVVGIDINVGAVEEAKRNSKLEGIDFSVQDARQTDFKDAEFDAVIEQAVLACMERHDRAKVLQEVWRILKPGGILSVAEFGVRLDNEDRYRQDAEITGEYGTMVIRHSDGSEWFRSHNFTRSELDGLTHDAGFEVMDYLDSVFPTIKYKLHPGHIYILRKP